MNVSAAYAAVAEKDGALPEKQNSANLASAIRGIPTGGSGSPEPLDPVEVYKNTRPADWLPMPEPQNNEMYLLFHIPDGVSSLLAFTVQCTGSYTVAVGSVTNGQFVQQSAVSVVSGQKYEAELFASNFGNLTSTGMKQCMVKVSGTNITTWGPSAHSKKSSSFFSWNIVEISCRLPVGIKVACGSSYSGQQLYALRYFSWYGENNVTYTNNMFSNCYSLIAVTELNTSKVTTMDSMFMSCYSLVAIPELNTANVTNMRCMLMNCYSLVAIPELNTANTTNIDGMFTSCYSLVAFPELDTSKVTAMATTFTNCYSLTAISNLNTGMATSAMTVSCKSLAKITLCPTVTGWNGCNIILSNCCLGHKALIDFFNSLPTITSQKTLTLTGNPGVSELTNAEKAIAAGKNWALTL